MEIEMETTMKITEKLKNYFRLGMSSIFILALASLLMACGSGGGGGSTSAGVSTDTGNTISGRVALAGVSIGRSLFAISDTDDVYTTATVQLVDSDGNMVAETTTDEDGKFEFNNVAEGDYTVIVIDNETGKVVTQVDISLLEGDDVDIEGVIDTTGTEWTIEFTSNDDESDLQNDAQTQHAENLAEASGLDVDEVTAMRLDGMGWGQIAKELGVHPGVLGLGNDKAFDTEQTTDTEEGSVGSNTDDKGKPDKDNGKPDDKGKPDKDNGKPDDKGKPDKDNGNSGNNN